MHVKNVYLPLWIQGTWGIGKSHALARRPWDNYYLFSLESSMVVFLADYARWLEVHMYRWEKYPK